VVIALLSRGIPEKSMGDLDWLVVLFGELIVGIAGVLAAVMT
jgi:hypothetical protein